MSSNVSLGIRDGLTGRMGNEMAYEEACGWKFPGFSSGPSSYQRIIRSFAILFQPAE
jgi:hypothetical protein